MNNNQKTEIINGWRFYDLPVKYSETDYQEAKDELINKAQKTPELIALFESGCILALGISDMDFFAIFSDNSKTMLISDSPIISLKTRYLMKHKILVISEKHYSKILYLDPWITYAWPNGHNLLWQREDIKRDLNFEKIKFNQEQRNILSILYIEELLEAVYSNVPFYANKEIPIRSSFETLKNCVYIIEEINIVTDRKIDNSFSEEFNDLRKNWFNIEEKEAFKKFLDILYKGLIIGFEAAFSLNDWLNNNSELISSNDLGIKKTNFLDNSYLNKNYKNIYINTFKDRRVFTDLVKTPEQALKLSVDSYKKIKINLGVRNKSIDFYTVFQPLKMASIPLAFINENGILSNNLRNDIYTNQEQVPIFKSKVFQEKIRMINEITEIYNKKQRKNSAGKGFIFGNHRFGYLFEKEKLRRKLLTLYIKHKFWKTINKLK